MLPGSVRQVTLISAKQKGNFSHREYIDYFMQLATPVNVSLVRVSLHTGLLVTSIFKKSMQARFQASFIPASVPKRFSTYFGSKIP